MRAPVKTILWDNDGVLVDSEQLYFEVTRDVLATAGIALTDEQYRDLFLVQGRGAWHLCGERGIPELEIARLRSTRNALYSDGLRRESLALADVGPVLGALHGRYPMGCVTSSRRDHFDLLHGWTGFLPYFDFVLTADDVTRVKPDPELYVRAVERSGHRAAECLAIEDSERGLAAARAAGVPCLIVPTPLTRGCAFEGAERVLDRVTDVLTLL
jgi:beta-phosphoglucomutase-like phosphatase (HAD superfamily)